MLRQLIHTIKFIAGHPLNRNHKLAALLRWGAWQIGGRLVPGPVVMPFVNNSCLLVEPGITAATGNLYTGLFEFDEMSFLLHFLRAPDLFVDVGANVGAYTVLASAVVGATTVSVEPVPATFQRLLRNISLNAIQTRVRVHNVGLARAAGSARFTAGLDACNHVIATAKEYPDSVTVKTKTLDDIAVDITPNLLKIDVEGFETEVIAGGARVLSNPALLALIVELNGSGARYGFDENALRGRIVNSGFSPCRYFPLTRTLEVEKESVGGGLNTIFVRDPTTAQERLLSATAFRVLNDEI